MLSGESSRECGTDLMLAWYSIRDIAFLLVLVLV